MRAGVASSTFVAPARAIAVRVCGLGRANRKESDDDDGRGAA